MPNSGHTADRSRATVLLELSFDMGVLSTVRRQLREAIIDAGVDMERADSFTFAINEGLINAIMHGGGTGEITLLRDADRLQAVVEDRKPTAPFDVPQSLPEPSAVGGRGLWLIARSCDAMRMEQGRRGLRLIMELTVTS